MGDTKEAGRRARKEMGAKVVAVETRLGDDVTTCHMRIGEGELTGVKGTESITRVMKVGK